MKKIILLFFVTTIGFAQKKELKTQIETFFNGMHTRDTVKIKSVCHDKMLLQSILVKNNASTLTEEKAEKFYKSIMSIPVTIKIEERIKKYNYQLSGNMATVITPYEFYVNDTLSHTGNNQFTFVLENNIWKIAHIIDTRIIPKK
jgi:signal transduction protein with GAF and PtsI domain